MKLLFDENLSFRLPDAVADLFPGSAHVRSLGLKGRADDTIWEVAARQGFVIVSKDRDFFDKAVVAGGTPKFVWIRLGNVSTKAVEDVIRSNSGRIEALGASSEIVLILS